MQPTGYLIKENLLKPLIVSDQGFCNFLESLFASTRGVAQSYFGRMHEKRYYAVKSKMPHNPQSMD